MKETVLITGANSFIAKHLIPILEKEYIVKLLTRKPTQPNEFFWDVSANKIDENALDDVNYIVHLAGSKLNDGTPLTAERKMLIRESRIGAANFLKDKLVERNQQLVSFVSASAIGYYGFTDSTLEIDEEGEIGVGFNAELCRDWELAADEFITEGVADHVSKIRVSLVLGNESGIFPIFKSMVANNPQVTAKSSDSAFLWNHVSDMAGIFAFAVQNKLDGVFNSVAPEPASDQDVFKAIANESIGAGLKIIPFKGQHLVSNKIIASGYQFKFPNIEEGVADLFNHN